jgi:hypothetical protein
LGRGAQGKDPLIAQNEAYSIAEWHMVETGERKKE